MIKVGKLMVNLKRRCQGKSSGGSSHIYRGRARSSFDLTFPPSAGLFAISAEYERRIAKKKLIIQGSQKRERKGKKRIRTNKLSLIHISEPTRPY